MPLSIQAPSLLLSRLRARSTKPVADMEQELNRLKLEAEQTLAQITNGEQLEAFRVKYLGRKGGSLTGILRQLGSVSPEDRPRLGQLANEVKQGIEAKFDEKKLPPRDAFYSSLMKECTSDEDYLRAKQVWHTFKCKTFKDYHDFF